MGQGCLVMVSLGVYGTLGFNSLFQFLLMTSVANWQDSELTILSARVQVPSKGRGIVENSLS